MLNGAAPASGRHENRSLTKLRSKSHNEVFSPGIRTQLKGAVDAAGQASSESSGTSSAALGTGSHQTTFDAPPAHGADLQRCLPYPSVAGEILVRKPQ